MESSCLIPLVGLKLGVMFPLTRKEIEDEKMQERMSLDNPGGS